MRSGSLEYHVQSHNFQMVLTASQITNFFEDASQMGLFNRSRFDSLNTEGIMPVDDLAEWDDDGWDQWMSNCKNPDRIPDPTCASQ